MPVPFQGPPTELDGLAMFLDEQRAALLRKLEGLTDEQASSHPTASGFCMLTLVKHVAFVERRWFQLEIARWDVPGRRHPARRSTGRGGSDSSRDAPNHCSAGAGCP